MFSRKVSQAQSSPESFLRAQVLEKGPMDQVVEVAEQQKVELEKKNNAALKEMCAAKG